MLDDNLQKDLDALLKKLSPEQKAWVAEYISSGGKTQAAGGTPVSVFFATETGNTQTTAQEFSKFARENGIKAKVAPINKANVKQLSEAKEIVLFIAATHGEGDPPEKAKSFFKELSESSQNLASLNFAMLGLGDSSYPKFCQFAVDVSDNLKRLGANELLEPKLLDVDYKNHTSTWFESAVKLIKEKAGDTGSIVVSSAPSRPKSTRGYNRLEAVEAVVKDIVNLNDVGSNKETFHIEVELLEPVSYAPGDSIGIVMPAGSDGVVPTPRLYSIASAPAAHGNEVHMTVAHAWHTLPDGTRGFGLCSHFLAGVKPGDKLVTYIHENSLFRLPSDDTDVIMIGPGTGIAPFRSFLFERAERGSSGKNWLFFGDQHAHLDFLYQLELQEMLGSGILSKIDLAFSRDGAQKVYVQHRMKQNAKELVNWLEGGASLYLCGSKDPMSIDVDKALQEVVSEVKGIPLEKAAEYIAELEENGRYLKDVY